MGMSGISGIIGPGEIRTMLMLETQGMTSVLPAFVIGVGVADPYALLRAEPKLPTWMMLVHQAAGGMLMFYPSFFGLVLRLTANAPDEAAARAIETDLEAMGGTWGGPGYTAEELATIDARLAVHWRVPRCASGVEAWVTCDCEPAALLDYFQGWRVLSCEWSKGAEFTPRTIDYSTKESAGDDLLVDDDLDLDAGMLQRLGDEVTRLGLSGPLRTFLLWDNCD